MNVPVPPWADLLPDLLRHISGRIGDPADYVRFHAVCRTRRDALPTFPAHYPLFPPWLLAPGQSTTSASTPSAEHGGDGDGRLEESETTTRSEPLVRAQRLSIHAFESRGELLAACVVLATPDDADHKDGGGDSRALAAAMSVWVYALEEPEKSAVDGQGSRRQRWVWRDGRSLSDRVLFLGSPTSFAVDAARFAGAALSGGCAYFVLDSQEAGWSWRNVPEARRVYRYSFEDGSATELEELPDTDGTGWDSDKAMMWIMPHAYAITPLHADLYDIFDDGIQ
ncbi:hypothetical protein EJB05_43983, partial [Eragrostis curvula]